MAKVIWEGKLPWNPQFDAEKNTHRAVATGDDILVERKGYDAMGVIKWDPAYKDTAEGLRRYLLREIYKNV